ncbi:MAG: efflux RND transporter permease subunit [Firmicutes bacterium]|nr:efflux RND transporter permease subunit [Bacillota bacterium]
MRILRLQRLMFGPGTGAEVEARISGHDIEALRELAEQAKDLMYAEPLLRYIRDDWRQPSLGVRPLYNEERGRQLGIQRDELAQALQFASSGVTVGQYRDGYNLLPIIARAPQYERDNVALLPDRLVWSNSQQSYVPMTQLVDGFQTVNEESQVRRYQRVRTITVMADSVLDATSAQAQSAIEERFAELDLPVGFSLEWGGDFESSTDAQTELMKDLPVSLLIMLFVSILLFGRLRQPPIIWAVVPMAICGMVIGLLMTDLPFSFTATLGMLSLSGMLMKNAIVLVDEIDNRLTTEDDRYTALIDASVSRLRPVLLTAGTTSLGMLPLLWDAFFASMAVTIIGGLLFASLLTLIAVPVLYSLLFRITSTTQKASA